MSESKAAGIVSAVKRIVNTALTDTDYELAEVEYKLEYGSWHLVIAIDNKSGSEITLDDCEKVSRMVEPLLDDSDPTAGQPYSLDVSSSGFDRPLKTQRDFQRNYGNEVEVKFYSKQNNQKQVVGILLDRNDDRILLESCGEQLNISNSLVALVRRTVKFD